MPAKSKAQQKLFALVHAYKQGKLPNVSKKIKQIAQHISDEDAKKYASTKHEHLPELKELFHSPAFIQETLKEIQQSKTPDYVKGKLIDEYTASMLLVAMKHLHEDHRKQLLSYPINEMVLLSYKLLTA